MIVNYIAQPDTQLGPIVLELLDSDPPPSRVVLVSAFVGLQTIVRLKEKVIDLKGKHTEIRFVLGIDLGGTSQEVLEEILGWGLDIRIVRNRIPRHIFHPKLYLFEWEHQAIIFIGSNNLTEGGFFGNYEGAARVVYQLPIDLEAYNTACDSLKRFLDPHGPIVRQLTREVLDQLVAAGDLSTESEARRRRDVSARGGGGIKAQASPTFGTEEFPLPPPLPKSLLEGLVKKVRQRRRAERTAIQQTASGGPGTPLPVDEHKEEPLLPAAFYMTLPTLQGPSIPGEARIPLDAIGLAEEFWGWPDEYARTVNPTAGSTRVYWNWRPQWRVWSVEDPTTVAVQNVRMYMYENSSDFRFYARPLVDAGADAGDIVRITRIAEPDGPEYECVLARTTTVEYAEWIKYCTQPVQNSNRRFGYA